MRFRCWEDMNESEPEPDDAAAHFEAESAEEAAEMYVQKLEDLSETGNGIEVNVSAPSGATHRVYWTVHVDVDWSPDFSARKARLREGPP